jgi:hypothetical protein
MPPPKPPVGVVVTSRTTMLPPAPPAVSDTAPPLEWMPPMLIWPLVVVKVTAPPLVWMRSLTSALEMMRSPAVTVNVSAGCHSGQVQQVVGQVLKDDVARGLQGDAARQALQRLFGNREVVDRISIASIDNVVSGVTSPSFAPPAPLAMMMSRGSSNTLPARPLGADTSTVLRNSQAPLARRFHIAAVAALRAAARADGRARTGGLVAPQHHGAAVAVVRGIGPDRAAGLGHRLGRVGDAGVLALPAPADQHLAAARRPAGVDDRPALELDLVGRGVDLPAQAAPLGRDGCR